VCSRSIAWIATAFFIAGPPSLVLWTLSGSAEIVMTLVFGAVLLLAVDEWRRSSSPRALVLAGVALGLGLWVQQYILYYVVALALAAALEIPGWRETSARLLRERLPRWLRSVLIVLAAVAAVYVLLGLIAFFTGGFEVYVAAMHHRHTCRRVADCRDARVGRRQWRRRGIQSQLMWRDRPEPVTRPRSPGASQKQGMGAPISRMNLASFAKRCLISWGDGADAVRIPRSAGRATVFPSRSCARLLVPVRAARGRRHHAVLSPHPRRRPRCF
jgi:hypothetical protein